MNEQEPIRSSATSASLVLNDSGQVAPLKSLVDLDPKTMATLFDDATRHENIVQWFSLIGIALLVTWNLGSLFGLLPMGVILYILAVSAMHHRHWLRECAELGMDKQQARDLRRTLNTAQRQLPKRRHLSDEEWLDLLVQNVLNRLPALTDGKGKETM